MAEKKAKTGKNRTAQKITARTNGGEVLLVTKVECFAGEYAFEFLHPTDNITDSGWLK
jgi:hypothetical protein